MSSESTLVKMPHFLKSGVTAHLSFRSMFGLFLNIYLNKANPSDTEAPFWTKTCPLQMA